MSGEQKEGQRKRNYASIEEDVEQEVPNEERTTHSDLRETTQQPFSVTKSQNQHRCPDMAAAAGDAVKSGTHSSAIVSTTKNVWLSEKCQNS